GAAARWRRRPRGPAGPAARRPGAGGRVRAGRQRRGAVPGRDLRHELRGLASQEPAPGAASSARAGHRADQCMGRPWRLAGALHHGRRADRRRRGEIRARGPGPRAGPGLRGTLRA
ncbi:unnamed protein product, partial [Prorocentrum cordatum]